MDKKKFLIIGGSVGGALLVALVVVSIVLANRPAALIVRAAANTISDIKKIEAYDVADDVINGGSVSVSANLEKFAKDDLTVDAKLYTNIRDLKAAYDMTLKEDGDEILNGNVRFNQDKVTLACDELFDGTYGVSFKNLSKNLMGSIFDPDEETGYSFDDEEFEYFLNLKDTIKNDKNLERDITNMVAKYRRLAIEKFIKYSDITRTSKTVTISGDNISCTVVTATADEKTLALVFQDLIDYANDDEELENLVYRLASNVAFYEETEDLVDYFYDGLEDLEDGLDYLEDSDFEAEISFYITNSGRRIAQIDAEVEYDGDEYELSLILGRNVTTSKEMSLEAKDKNTGEGIAVTYKVKENSSRLYEAELKIVDYYLDRYYVDYDWNNDWDDDQYEELSSNTTTIKAEWDRKAGDLKVKYEDEWDDYVIKGSLLKKGDKYIFVLTNVRCDGEPVARIKSLELTVIVDRHDPAPNAGGKFTEIATMDERGFKHFTSDIEEGIEDIAREYFR